MDINTLSGSTLAYLGDAVWSLLVREYLIELGYNKPKSLQVKSVKYVSAKAQAYFYEQLTAQAYFTEEEETMYRRGRNYKSQSTPKNTDIATYHSSTGFEALFGYLYITNQQGRIEQTWEKIKTMVEV